MIEDKQVRHLIAMGQERGYLLYDEVNDILPAEVHSSEEIDDLLSTLSTTGSMFTKTCRPRRLHSQLPIRLSRLKLRRKNLHRKRATST